jgi:hypothetical protein
MFAESSITSGDSGNIEYLSYCVCSMCSKKIFVDDDREIIGSHVLCSNCSCSND